jgi:hypothetical protein
MSKTTTVEQQTMLDGSDLLVKPAPIEPSWEQHDAEHAANLPATAPLDHSRSTDIALTPLDLIVRAQEQNASPEVLEKYMLLHERWRESEAKRAYNSAIADAQAEMPVIEKNRKVDYPGKGGKVSYRHEDLAEIERSVKPIMAKHGLSYRWRTKVEGSTLYVTCIVSHRDGYSEENTLFGPADTSGAKNAIQAIGSTQTYLCRYTLKAALGLAASEDADGRVEHENPEHDKTAPKTAPRGERDTPERIKTEVGDIHNAWIEGKDFASKEDTRLAFAAFVHSATGTEFPVGVSTNWDREKINKCWEALQGPPGEEGVPW